MQRKPHDHRRLVTRAASALRFSAPLLLGPLLLCAPACEEDHTPGGSTATIEPASIEPITAEKMPLFQMQIRIDLMVKDGDYEGAANLISNLDLATYVEEASIAGPAGMPQYWAIRDEGIGMPYVGDSETITAEEKTQIKQDAWVVPGTTESSGDQDKEEWHDRAALAAQKFNQLLHKALSETPE